MITGDYVGKLVNLLESRQVRLYHACQLTDYLAYMQIGGIPSRQRLESSGNPFTPFDTDGADRVNGVWDKVFVNLSDFGNTFANGNGATPNTYGPILLIIQPASLSNAIDVAITLRSAGAKDYDRELESLSCIEQVDKLFCYPLKKGSPASSYVKYGDQLQIDFENKSARNPEINCFFTDGIIPCRYISGIIIDPYTFYGTELRKLIRDTTESNELKRRINPRLCKCKERIHVYNELAGLFVDGIPPLQKIVHSTCSDELNRWIDQIKGFNLEWQYIRFANYLRNGTLIPAQNMINN